LLARLGHAPANEPGPSSTLLGDWYANLIFLRGARLVLCVSERTLLPVVLHARELATLGARLPSAAGDVLAAIGIPAQIAHDERDRMTEVVFARTASRRILGSMNDLAYLLAADFDANASLLDLALNLAETPCGPLGMESPTRATLAAPVSVADGPASLRTAHRELQLVPGRDAPRHRL
jgi:hypothetical protein